VTCVDGSVREIKLSNVGLSGTLPEQIGAMESLETLDLSNNELTGPIPVSYGSMTSMRRMDLHNNFLGSPPGGRRQLESRSLQTISDDLILLSSLPLLEYLDISGNGYTGQVPALLCDPPLQTLLLSSLLPSAKYPPNDFSCIASCLTEDANLVLVRPAALPVCENNSPTVAPTQQVGGLGNQNATTGFGTTNIISLVVGIVLFLIVTCVIAAIFWRRYKDQKEAEGDNNVASWKDKEKSRLNLTKLKNIDGMSVESGSVGSGRRDFRRRDIGDGFEIRSQSSGDINFPIVVDFDEERSEDSDDDDMTAEYFGNLRNEEGSRSSYSSGSRSSHSSGSRSSHSSGSRSSRSSNVSAAGTLSTGRGSSSASSSDASSRLSKSTMQSRHSLGDNSDMSSVSHSVYSDSISATSYSNSLPIREEDDEDLAAEEDDEEVDEPIFAHHDEGLMSPDQSHFSTFAEFYRPDTGDSSVGSRGLRKGDESSAERRRREEEEAQLEADFSRPIVYRAGSSQSLGSSTSQQQSASLLDIFKKSPNADRKEVLRVKSQKFGL
jgi:hypothetical protein